MNRVAKEKIIIKIFGREYEVNSEEDPLNIYALASFVDQKMKEISHITNIVDTSKVAVLAALNIADEVFKLKERSNLVKSSIDKKREELAKELEIALK